MVAAAHLVHHWARGDGRARASTQEFVSVPCHLDIATLDTRYRTGVSDAIRGVSSNNRGSPQHSAYTECTARGRRALPDLVVALVDPDFWDASKPRVRHLLRP